MSRFRYTANREIRSFGCGIVRTRFPEKGVLAVLITGGDVKESYSKIEISKREYVNESNRSSSPSCCHSSEDEYLDKRTAADLMHRGEDKFTLTE
jgi:hypothetical protein